MALRLSKTALARMEEQARTRVAHVNECVKGAVELLREAYHIAACEDMHVQHDISAALRLLTPEN